MTAIIPFAFDDALVRVTDIDGNPWFVAKDVCAVLGIVWKGSDSTGPLGSMDEDEKGTLNESTLGGPLIERASPPKGVAIGDILCDLDDGRGDTLNINEGKGVISNHSPGSCRSPVLNEGEVMMTSPLTVVIMTTVAEPWVQVITTQLPGDSHSGEGACVITAPSAGAVVEGGVQ